MCRVIQPHAGIDGESRSFEFGNDGCLHRLFNWMRNAEDEENDGNEAGEDDSHGDREARKATEGNKTTMKAKKINFSPDSLAPWNWKFPRLKANQGEALAVTGQNPPPPSKGAKRGAARGRPPHNNHQPHSSPPSSRRPMPKLLHTLCCCIRPDNYNRKKNDSSNSTAADGCIDPRTSPISQVSKGSGQPSSKSVPTQIAGELRQRLLVPRPETSKGLGLGQRTQLVLGIGQNNNNNSSQNANNNNNNNLAILGGDKFGHVMHKEHHCLLPRVMSTDAHRKCLIVDLDETLVHSSFKPVKNADFVIPVEIDNVVHQVYVLKRPHTDHFLERIGSMFECVLFTASLAKYADPVADLLDKRRVFRNRLFREACVFFEGNYVKDLERLGRDLRKVVIIDNSPASYAFHPDNAIAVRTWFDDPNDTELLDLLPMLEELAQADDIYRVLGTVPPHQQPRCLTPSEDLIQPPPMASSSPITQVVQPNGQNNNNNGNGGSQPQPWRKGQYSRMMDDKYRRNLESVPPSSKR